MFGVPIDGPAQVYCNNQGVVKNTSVGGIKETQFNKSSCGTRGSSSWNFTSMISFSRNATVDTGRNIVDAVLYIGKV